MPVSPDYAADLAKGLLGVYVAAEERILRLIGEKLAKGLAAPAWRETALRELQGLRIQTEKIVRLVDERGTAALTEAVWTAYNRGVATAGVDLAAVGGTLSSNFGSVHTRALTALVDTAKQTLGPSLLRIQSGAARMYSDVVADTAALELAGTMTRREAAAHSLRTWADRGVPGFVDKAGRAWDMGAYAEMTTRTAAGQAMVAGHVDRLQEAGHDLVMISDAPEECELCRPFEGRIFSMSGRTPSGAHGDAGARYEVKGRLSDAVAKGLFHPNCRHRTTVYIPGVTQPLVDTADPEGDALRQRQRAFERDIRKRKRRIAAVEPVDPALARVEKAKLRAKQVEFRAWREQHGRKDLAYRTSIAMPKPSAGGTAPVFPDGLPTPPPTPTAATAKPRPAVKAPAAAESTSVLRKALAEPPPPELREALQAVVAGHLGGGVTARVTDMRWLPLEPGTTQRAEMRVEFNSAEKDRWGDPVTVGSAKRRFFVDADGNLGVEHVILELHRSVQGKGIGSTFNRRMEELYRDNGVAYIDLEANIDVGGYAWARAGYDWSPSATAAQVQEILDDVNRLIRVDGPDRDRVAGWLDVVRAGDRAEWPTPFDVSQVGWKEGEKSWPGKGALLGSKWDGRKYLRKEAPVEAPKPTRAKPTPRPVPADILDRNTRELRAVPDDELEAALLRAFEAEAVSGDTLPATDRVMREIDRRQQAELKAATAAETRREAARLRKENAEREKWDAVQEAIDDGMDPEEAVERYTGVTVEQQRRASLLVRLRAEGYTGDQSLRNLLRRKFKDEIYRRYIEAEDFTRGHMVTPLWQARDLDPISLFTGPEAVARKRASEELRTYWDRYGRLTFEQFVDQQVNGGAAKRVVSDWVT